MDVQSMTDDGEEVLDGVHLAQLAAGRQGSVQHFRIESGALVGTHSHEHEQIGWVSSGELLFTVDGEEYLVGPNTSYVIPGGVPHSAENRGEVDAVGIEVFSPPRLTPPWEGDDE
ncbi:cupin domain-containing protein [Haloferax chudinovii]|uniref:Cupin domain-containing protein n=1 Tax=Haloferax chudinovii TaxID=1109010 RepID=A0ABD5XQP3_9EURY